MDGVGDGAAVAISAVYFLVASGFFGVGWDFRGLVGGAHGFTVKRFGFKCV